MTIYKLYAYNNDIKTLIRVAMFTKDKDSTDVQIDSEFFNKEELNKNLFHPLLLDLNVVLLIDELQRNIPYIHTETLMESLYYAFDESDLTTAENIEAFKSAFYQYLGFKTIGKQLWTSYFTLKDNT